MQKLFLVALIVGVCTPSISAQGTVKFGITVVPPNLRFDSPETSKQDTKISPSNSHGAVGAPVTRVQCPPRCPSGRTKFEIYGGYSFMRLDFVNRDDGVINNIFRDRRNLHGFDVSATYNFSRYVGGQFDFSFHRRSGDFIASGLAGEAEASVQNFLFGVQVKDNSEDAPTLRPFGHALAGVSRQRLELESSQFIPTFGDDDITFRKSSFALAMGGGLDIRLSDRFSIRAVKFDYLPVFVDDFNALGVSFDRRTQHNFRVGAGVVLSY